MESIKPTQKLAKYKCQCLFELKDFVTVSNIHKWAETACMTAIHERLQLHFFSEVHGKTVVLRKPGVSNKK